MCEFVSVCVRTCECVSVRTTEVYTTWYRRRYKPRLSHRVYRMLYVVTTRALYHKQMLSVIGCKHLLNVTHQRRREERRKGSGTEAPA